MFTSHGHGNIATHLHLGWQHTRCLFTHHSHGGSYPTLTLTHTHTYIYTTPSSRAHTHTVSHTHTLTHTHEQTNKHTHTPTGLCHYSKLLRGTSSSAKHLKLIT